MSSTWHFENQSVRVLKVEVGDFGNNAYVVACRATNASIIVDAAADAAHIVELAAATDPVAVVTTHGHADHVGAAMDVSKAFDIPILLHRADWELCPVQAHGELEAGEFEIGDSSVRLVHVPGHTPGSVGLVGDGVAITGDALFPGGPGATRFPYSDFDQIMDSIESEFFSLPDDTIVMPGHGLDTTIGAERPSLPEWRDRRW